jgi:hypothetical protein
MRDRRHFTRHVKPFVGAQNRSLGAQGVVDEVYFGPPECAAISKCAMSLLRSRSPDLRSIIEFRSASFRWPLIELQRSLGAMRACMQCLVLGETVCL